MKKTLRILTRRLKWSGAFAAGSLASIQNRTSSNPRDRFKCLPTGRHQHAWVYGAENKVCSKCGLTVPKE